MWKLEIHDSGDHSVGIFSQTWYVDVPFDVSKEDDETLDFFKNEIAKIYAEFCEGRLTLGYIKELNQPNIKISQVKDSIINIT